MQQSKEMSWGVLVFIFSFALLSTFRLVFAEGIQKLSITKVTGSVSTSDIIRSSTVISTAGGYHTCAKILDGAVVCWGKNVMGQLGHRTDVEEMRVPVPLIQLGGSAVSVAAGTNHSCAAIDTGAVKCWGENDEGQLGTGDKTGRNAPETVSDLGGLAIAVTTGQFHTCALMDDGSAKCWGDNAHGKLGNGIENDSLTPVSVLLSGPAIAIEAGDHHTCSLMATGRTECWGKNSSGQLGINSTDSSHTPQEVVSMNRKTVTAIAAGRSHTCVVTDTGEVSCWGGNDHGQVGTGGTSDTKVPKSVSALAGDNTTGIAAGAYHTCVVLDTGTAKCWGRNDDGQLGNGTKNDSATPVDVEGIDNAATISAGDFHTCAALSSDSLKCWGRNSEGQLGDNSQSNSDNPITVYGF